MSVELKDIIPLSANVRDMMLMNYLHQTLDYGDTLHFGKSDVKLVCDDIYMSGINYQHFFITYKDEDVLYFKFNNVYSHPYTSGVTFYPEYDSHKNRFEDFEISTQESINVLQLSGKESNYMGKIGYHHQYLLFNQCINILYHMMYKNFNMESNIIGLTYYYHYSRMGRGRIGENPKGVLAKEALSILEKMKIKDSNIYITKAT